MDYPAITIGSTQHVTVMSAVALGDMGKRLAYIMSRTHLVEIYYRRLAAFFEAKTLPHLRLILSPLSPNHTGTGGAYHYGDFGADIYADVYLKPGEPGFRVPFSASLFVCEATEVFAAYQQKAWVSDYAHGEALSRVMGECLVPQAIYTGAVQAWFDAGCPDWISNFKASETDQVAVGCGMTFIHYLHDQLHFSFNEIIAASSYIPTLEAVFNNLTKRHGGYHEMMAVIDKVYPPGKPAHTPRNETVFPIR